MIFLKFREKAGNLPTSIFDLMNDEKKVGFVQIRHKVSAGAGIPNECASHLYYEVEESEWNKGYGTEALRLALIEAKKIGLEKVVVTCDENNIPSKRIIEKNGGIYTKSCLCNNKIKLLRFEFELK